jgi:hypothetical protein
LFGLSDGLAKIKRFLGLMPSAFGSWDLRRSKKKEKKKTIHLILMLSSLFLPPTFGVALQINHRRQ